MLRIRQAKLLGVLLTVAMLGLSACQAAEPVPGVTADEIKIGVPTVFTGSLALDGDFTKKTVDLIVNRANAAGGVNGRKIKIVYEDDGCDATKGVAAVRKLLDRDQVFAILGTSCTPVSVAVSQLADQEKFPFLIGVPLPVKVAQEYHRYTFVNNIIGTEQAPALTDWVMQNMKPKRVALLYYELESANSLNDGIKAYLKSKYNMDPVADEHFKFGQADISANILRVKASNPDVVVASVLGTQGGAQLQQVRQMGITAPIVGGTFLNIVGTAKAAGSAIDGVTYLEMHADSPDGATNASFAEFIKDFRTAYADIPTRDMGTVNWTVGAATASMIEGLKRAGRDITREKLVDALETLNKFDAKTAVITYTNKSHYGPAMVNIYRWKADGTRTKIAGPIEVKK